MATKTAIAIQNEELNKEIATLLRDISTRMDKLEASASALEAAVSDFVGNVKDTKSSSTAKSK